MTSSAKPLKSNGFVSITLSISNFVMLYYNNGDKHIKTKVKVYGEELNTSFQGKKIPKEDILCKCLSLIILDSISEVAIY